MDRPVPPLIDPLLARFVDLIADAVAEKLAARRPTPAGPPELATARSNPLGSARAFLDAARRGDFPSSRRGREVVATWSDVESYDRSRLRPRPLARTALTPDAKRLEALKKAGAVPRNT